VLREALARSNKQDLPELLCSKFFLWSFPDHRDDALLEECKQKLEAVSKDLIVTVIRKVAR
jgi:hypothetical protein